MGRPALDLYRRKFAKLIGITADDELAWLIWAVSTLQSSRPERAKLLISYPEEAVTQDVGSRYYAHPWRMETIFNEALVAPKIEVNQPPYRKLVCTSFGAMAMLMNAIGKVEDQESGLSLKYLDVISELHRIAQRQFEWQRGFINLGALYRASFIYGGPLARGRFADRRGIELDDFCRCCFVLMASWFSRPIMARDSDFSVAGISKQQLDATLEAISIEHAEDRILAAKQRATENQTAYKQSILRQYPVIRFNNDSEYLIAPLPQLISSRATSGLYYDLIGGRGDVRNEISGRFENYCRRIIRTVLSDAAVVDGSLYSIRGRSFETFDAGILDAGEIAVIVECKATKLTYDAKFSEFPLVEAEDKYSEIVKGVFQIWRYISHVRRGLAPAAAISKDAVGMVLTLDAWLMMSTPMQREVTNRAVKLAKSQESEITSEDQIPVIFCPIDDLELVLANCTSESLLETARKSAHDEFYGWMMYNVHQQLFPEIRHGRTYPFLEQLPEVAPWWGDMQAIMGRGPPNV
ncbi:hypothetical protein [Methylobacterium sp. J-077]|uniref:hypothetical protein n=1 Tax=Methylobacterium sp. J-077 TaxID=2836656 RepID=UPI001FBA3BA4|nr:hypothetical protein [Methylobacterium sp. J-077]MCJ2126774.1 hypothetical protein [Methylobacterium sp. J-077]